MIDNIKNYLFECWAYTKIHFLILNCWIRLILLILIIVPYLVYWGFRHGHFDFSNDVDERLDKIGEFLISDNSFILNYIISPEKFILDCSLPDALERLGIPYRYIVPEWLRKRDKQNVFNEVMVSSKNCKNLFKLSYMENPDAKL